MKKYFAIVAADDTVSSIHCSPQGDVPQCGDGLRPVEISDETAAQIEAVGLQYDFVVARWRVDDLGQVVEQPDTRPVLTVAIGDKLVNAGEPVEITFWIEPAADLSLPLLVTCNDVPKRVKVTFIAGIAQLSRELAVGRYQLASAEPSQYRLEGDRAFEVVEDWS